MSLIRAELDFLSSCVIFSKSAANGRTHHVLSCARHVSLEQRFQQSMHGIQVFPSRHPGWLT